jgi:putative acetyltransferase
MTPITLRRARPADAADYAALMNDPLVYPGVLQLPYTDAELWRTRLAEPGGATVAELHLVAEADGRVIGGAGLHAAGAAVRRRHVMNVGMSVAGDRQGQGVGTQLLTALCHHADRWVGALRLELTVYTDNRRAIALYRKHGFEVEGTHRAFALRDGVYVDAHTMARLHPNPPALPSSFSAQA